MASLIRVYLPDPQWSKAGIDAFTDETSLWAWSSRSAPKNRPWCEDQPWFYALCQEAHETMMGRNYAFGYGKEREGFFVELEDAGVATLFKLKWG